jgi:hypothetical protein
VWNACADRRPALVVRCTDAEDDIAAIDFARDQKLSVPVRSGEAYPPATYAAWPPSNDATTPANMFRDNQIVAPG